MYSLIDEPVRLERRVRFGAYAYDFCVRSGDEAWPDLRRRLRELDADAFLLVADAGIPPTMVAQTETALGAVARTVTLSVPPGEVTKRLGTLDQLVDRAVAAGVSRKTVVVALGGGVAGNIAGLLAALLFRGVRLVHLPTTLLGMSDSTLSLKQAVNSRHGKNHLGTFHAPVLVWNNLDFLATLPAEETRSALCEMIKNVLGIVPERYDDVARRLRPDADYSARVLADFIELCVDAKTQVMAQDQYEKGDALILEYGHTVGHAAELLTGGRLRHGFAIGVGMLAAAHVSRRLGYLDRAEEAAHRDLLALNGAPTALPAELDADSIIDVCRRDNKRGYVAGRYGELDLILLESLGRPLRSGGSLITQVDESLVHEGVLSLFDREPAVAGV